LTYKHHLISPAVHLFRDTMYYSITLYTYKVTTNLFAANSHITSPLSLVTSICSNIITLVLGENGVISK